MRDELGKSLALLPGSPKPRVRVSEPGESRVKKFICGRSAPTGALSVKRPAKNQLRRTIMLSSHPSQPMVDERGLSDPGPGNDCNDVDFLLGPRMIQKSDILLSTKNITSRNGQSGHRNFFRSKFYWRLASSGTRSGRRCLPQVLTSDFTPRVDSACYGRYRLQQLVRSLETLCRIFL